MNKRLAQIYRMIPKDGIGIADIGTDHGIIPIWLAENNYSGYIYASDIAEAPLQNALLYAQNHHVSDKIHFSVSDGLDDCPNDLVDCILIAGMGGDNICRILDRADWIVDKNYTFIFQPMTHAEVLRYWLVHNDFRIIKEVAVKEDLHLYQIFSAVPGKSSSLLDIEYLSGSPDAIHEGESIDTVYTELQHRILKKIQGMEGSRAENSSSYYFYQNILSDINEKLINM